MSFLPTDILLEIANHFDSVSDISKFRRTSKDIYSKIKLTPKPKDNSFLILHNLFPDQNWSYHKICKTKFFTPYIIDKYPEIHRHWGNLSENPNIDSSYILDTWNKHPWERSLSYKRNCSEELMCKIVKEIKDIDLYPLSRNPSLTPEIAKKLNIDLFNSNISNNPSFRAKYLHELGLLNTRQYIHNLGITMEDIKFLAIIHPGIDLSPIIHFGGNNPSISEFILENIQGPWNWHLVNQNPNIKCFHTEAYPNARWNKTEIKIREFGPDTLVDPLWLNDHQELVSYLSKHRIGKAEVDSLMNTRGQGIFHHLCRNPYFSVQDLLELLRKHKVDLHTRYVNGRSIMQTLSSRRDLTWDVVVNNSNVPWDFSEMFTFELNVGF